VLGESLQLQLASFRVGVRRNTIAGNTEGVSSYLFEGARKRTECHLVSPFPISLSFWVELVGACNSIWYQSERSLVRILAGTLIKIITAHSNIPRMRPGGACT
jgi:hypothetical protein